MATNEVALSKHSYRTSLGHVTYPDWSKRYSLVECSGNVHVHEYVEACGVSVYLGTIRGQVGK